jgi:hypothetical protein
MRAFFFFLVSLFITAVAVGEGPPRNAIPPFAQNLVHAAVSKRFPLPDADTTA